MRPISHEPDEEEFFWIHRSSARLLCFCPAEMVDIRAVSGQDVTLPCRAPNNDSIIAIEWFKPAEEETYLLLYRGGRILTDGQHPSYRSRVTFQKEKVKDGDASLSLRTVTEEDSGTYTCLVAQRNQKATSGSSNGRIPQTYIRLTVDSAPSCELLQFTSLHKYKPSTITGLFSGFTYRRSTIITIINFILCILFYDFLFGTKGCCT
uniref:Ig-like domain-containing protein n=1 Tax=Oryzias latipes TaxID=8090 RepID=A0A3P9LNP7_ORYLA